MRSSKSRSRSKQNRPRTLGNIINRVFESSGPEGKVRGTPQQIIEKYQLLARDAQLSNDRVAAENFLQHAEHYTRMLSEATREMAAEQEARQQQFGQQGGQNGQQGGQNGQHGGQNNGQHGQNNSQHGQNNAPQGGQQGHSGNRDSRDQRPWRDERSHDAGHGDQPEAGMIDDPRGEDTSLVETPEARPAGEPARREDRPRRNDRPEGERNNRNRDDNRNTRGPRPPRQDRSTEDRPAPAQDAAAGAPQPVQSEPAQGEGDKRAFDKPRAERPRSEKPAVEKPVVQNPVAENPVAEKAVADAPVDHSAPAGAGKPEAEAKVRRPRAPRKPKDSAEGGDKPADKGPREAAE